MRVAFVSLLAASAVLTAGCGAVGHLGDHSGDPAKGKPAFVTSCGGCHVLAAAGTQGTTGPDLDAAFGPDRCQGFKESTIRDVVRGQIAYAESDTGTGNPGMPPNLVNGQTAKDVSAYVASVAGINGTAAAHTGPYWDCATGAEVTG